MKLSTQYSKVNLIVAISVLFIAGIVYYTTISYIANDQLDTSLSEEIVEVTDYVKTNQQLPKPFDFDEDQTTFVKTNQLEIKRKFFDTLYCNPREKGCESGRAIIGLVTLKGVNYKVVVVESKEATENLIQLITLITIVLIAILLIVLVITNRYILDRLWKPFYNTLRQLKAFTITDIELNLDETKIDEFKELNSAVLSMSSRVKNDYQNLKTFTENASHEMMTPIAVITSKLDTLIQDETLKSDQYAQINDIYAATNKLSRLNQSLLLLVKIENDLVQDNAVLNLKEIILEKLHQFNELIQNKNIGVIHTLADKEITASKYLIDILINNLFNNAIRHNNAYGTIRIYLTNKQLVFQNTGDEQPLNPNGIFERFQKGKNSEGTGLGLTIAKNICSQYNFKLSYYFEDPLHTFQIEF